VSVFGDGSDGVLKAGEIIDLTRDMNYETHEPGARVRTNGYRVRFAGSATLPITIDDGVMTFGNVELGRIAFGETLTVEPGVEIVNGLEEFCGDCGAQVLGYHSCQGVPT